MMSGENRISEQIKTLEDKVEQLVSESSQYDISLLSNKIDEITLALQVAKMDSDYNWNTYTPLIYRGLEQSDRANSLIEGFQAVKPFRIRRNGAFGMLLDSTELPFLVRADPDVATSVRVWKGNWTRNGITIGLTCDSSEDYSTVTGLDTAGTYYIYVEFSSASPAKITELHPSALVAVKSTINVRPVDGIIADGYYNRRKVIAEVTVTSQGTPAVVSVSDVDQIHRDGDIDDLAYIPDSLAENGNLNLGDLGSHSLDFRGSASSQEGALELLDFAAGLDNFFVAARDHIEFRQATAGTIAPYYQRYCTLQNLCNQIDPADIGTNTGGGGAGSGGTIIEYINSGISKHTNLDFSGYPTIGIGKATFPENTDHDKVYLRVYNDMSGVAGHANYINGLAAAEIDKEIRSTDGCWFKELHLSADGAADTQYWTAAAILANVTGAIDLQCNANSQWISNTASKDLSIGTALKPWRELLLSSISRTNIYGNNTSSLFLGGVVSNSDNFANIYFNGVAGRDITDWTTKGGVTGTGIVEKRVSDLAPGDKVLCIPA